MYPIEPLSSVPPRMRVTRRLKYPFNELTVGTSFTVPADMADQFRHVRSGASDYAKRNDVKIHCSVQLDGSLLVWRDAKQGEQVIVASTNPTKFEFVSYLATMAMNQSFTLKAEFKPRFEEFVDWLLEYAGESGSSFGYESTEDTLTITRKEV